MLCVLEGKTDPDFVLIFPVQNNKRHFLLNWTLYLYVFSFNPKILIPDDIVILFYPNTHNSNIEITKNNRFAPCSFRFPCEFSPSGWVYSQDTMFRSNF